MEKTVNVLELVVELASRELKKTFKGTIYREEEDGVSYYTDDAQDAFNELVDEYEDIILKI